MLNKPYIELAATPAFISRSLSSACSRRRRRHDAAAGRRRSRRPSDTPHAPPPALPRQVGSLRLPAGGALPPTESPSSSPPRPPPLLRRRPANVRRQLLLSRHPPHSRLRLPQRRRLRQALAGNAGRQRSQLDFSCSTGTYSHHDFAKQ